jgi:hypothetical protein
MTEKGNTCRNLVEKPVRKDVLGGLNVGGRIILKWVFMIPTAGVKWS